VILPPLVFPALSLARLQILAQVQLFLFIMCQFSRVTLSSVLFVYLEDTVNVNQSFCQLFHDVRLVEVRPERDQSVLVLEENVQKLYLSLSLMLRKKHFYKRAQKARVFVPAEPLQPGLM